jgi:hypothetical protein
MLKYNNYFDAGMFFLFFLLCFFLGGEEVWLYLPDARLQKIEAPLSSTEKQRLLP